MGSGQPESSNLRQAIFGPPRHSEFALLALPVGLRLLDVVVRKSAGSVAPVGFPVKISQEISLQLDINSFLMSRSRAVVLMGEIMRYDDFVCATR